MTNTLRRSSCVFLTVALGACGSEPGPPTAPSPLTLAPAPPTPTLPRVKGVVKLVEIAPPSDRILEVRDCGPSWSGIPGRHVCADGWSGAFDVTLEVDVVRAVLTVTFEGPTGRCGMVYIASLTFEAGRERRVDTMTPLFLTYEPEGPEDPAVVQYCTLPATTSRMVVQIWDLDGGVGSAANPVLRQEFDYTYTFQH